MEETAARTAAKANKHVVAHVVKRLIQGVEAKPTD